MKLSMIGGNFNAAANYKMMKRVFIYVFVIVLGLPIVAAAQDKLIILVRHGEKAVLESEDNPDPELSEAGKQRAEKLVKTVGKYRPGAFYSTNFQRTHDTIAPWAKKRHKEISVYDAKTPQKLIDEIMVSKTKRFVVAGHSNTIPRLANLFGGKELFKNLEETEFGTIWLIRIKDGKVDNIKILPY